MSMVPPCRTGNCAAVIVAEAWKLGRCRQERRALPILNVPPVIDTGLLGPIAAGNDSAFRR